MQLIRRRIGLVTLLVFLGGAVALLHRLGDLEWLRIPWGSLGTWFVSAPMEDVLAAVLRHVAIVLAYWILCTTVVYLVARLRRIPRTMRSIEWVTVPAVRRVVDGALAVSIATASITAPALPAVAYELPPIVVEVDESGRPVPPGTPSDGSTSARNDTRPEEILMRPAGPRRIGWMPTSTGPGQDIVPVDDIGPSVPFLLDRGAATVTVSGSSAVIVADGDHLWSISRRHLEQAHDGAVSDDRVATYWRRVIEGNRDRLRSGDPDLIYPGETVVLPPIEIEEE